MTEHSAEEGFTLVELLIGLVVSTVIMSGLTAVLASAFGTGPDDARARVNAASDLGLATTLFPRDVASASAFDPGRTCVAGATTPIVTFVLAVDDVLVTWGTDGKVLRRTECGAGAAQSSTVMEDLVERPSLTCLDARWEREQRCSTARTIALHLRTRWTDATVTGVRRTP